MKEHIAIQQYPWQSRINNSQAKTIIIWRKKVAAKQRINTEPSSNLFWYNINNPLDALSLYISRQQKFCRFWYVRHLLHNDLSVGEQMLTILIPFYYIIFIPSRFERQIYLEDFSYICFSMQISICYVFGVS